MQFFRLQNGNLVRVSAIVGLERFDDARGGTILLAGGRSILATKQDLDTLENYFIEEGDVFEAGEED